MRIKICGLTTVEDAVMTAEAGADWLGLNFYPPSRRFIDRSIAREIVQSLPDTATAVGLFVDTPPSEVIDCAEQVGLRVIQLHGQEPPEDLLRLSRFTIVKAFCLGDHASIDTMLDYLDRAAKIGRIPDAILVDGFVPDIPGGTGVPIAEHLLSLIPALPRLILAGGLSPDNVADRIKLAQPWMVDVASGVESAPGRKDPLKVKKFINAANHPQKPA